MNDPSRQRDGRIRWATGFRQSRKSRAIVPFPDAGSVGIPKGKSWKPQTTSLSRQLPGILGAAFPGMPPYQASQPFPPAAISGIPARLSDCHPVKKAAIRRSQMAARPFAEHLRGFTASADPFVAIMHVFCLSRMIRGKEHGYLYIMFGRNATESVGLPVPAHRRRGYGKHGGWWGNPSAEKDLGQEHINPSGEERGGAKRALSAAVWCGVIANPRFFRAGNTGSGNFVRCPSDGLPAAPDDAPDGKPSCPEDSAGG